MEPRRNVLLETWMAEEGHSSRSLAEAINTEVGRLTGRDGGYDDASVRALKAGRIRWPNAVTRKALEAIAGRSALALGFVPRSRTPLPGGRQQEDVDMKRRTVALGGVAAAVAAAAPSSASRRIGMSDVRRVQDKFTEIIASDHRHGGKLSIQQRAAQLADEALAMQNAGIATQRVRSSLYASAAAFRSSAMWAAIDGRRYAEAQANMREAQALAEMSGDMAIKFRIWSHAGAMYRHLGRHGDALAANQVARSLNIVRRDPLFAALGLARQAAIHGLAQERTNARRALDQAREALFRADTGADRPVWLTAFFDEAELDSLALNAYLSLGDFPSAEKHGHRCLAQLRPAMARSRAITTTRLAHSQLGQGEPDAAVATAMKVSLSAATEHPRVSRMIMEFGAALRATAPRSSATRTWTDYTATWRTA
ncbi:XRE family transcriptional regulator [Streptomyces sp. NRRL F-5630]|uniref:XRE family transcriptional regulator n=1 Tax=Streptomyces sp. NRRL F-5630 TaxID=1463864 RepID=UPI003D74F551